MSKSFYVKFDVPKEIADAAYEALKISEQTGTVKKGTNETTKAVERSQGKLVVIAEDVDPPELVAHLPLLCEERKIPYLFVPDKYEIGKAIGIEVPSAAACITDEGKATGLISEIITRIEQIRQGAKQ
jgi:large subunit ribosomal protein L7Ae